MGYAPLHHRWCTRHLAENLLRKDGTKDNFPLFEKVARMLEVPFFEEKLEQLKMATNTEGRQWLRGLMREPKKWKARQRLARRLWHVVAHCGCGTSAAMDEHGPHAR